MQQFFPLRSLRISALSALPFNAAKLTAARQ